MGFFFDRQPKIKDGSFILTENGRQKLINHYDGSPQALVLVRLESGGSMDINELSRNTQLTTGHLERLLPVMIKRGWIQDISGTGSNELGV